MTENVIPLREGPGLGVVEEHVQRVGTADGYELPAYVVRAALFAEMRDGTPTEDALEHRARVEEERRERSRTFRVAGVLIR